VIYIWFDKLARRFGRFKIGNAITPEPQEEVVHGD
jgi:hypothetical protein